MKFLRILAVLLPIAFEAANARAGEFRWKVSVLDQKTKEEKIYRPVDNSTLPISVPGGFACDVSAVEKSDDSSWHNEIRFLTCTKGGITSGTNIACSFPKANPTYRHEAFSVWLGYDPTISQVQVANVSLQCER